MTDEELIRRLEETPPEEWSPEELAVLRARARESTAVRAALAEQIWLEQTLSRGLSRVRITADQVLARLDERRRGPLLFGRWLRAAAALLVLLGLGGVWYKLKHAPPDDRAAEVRRPTTDPGAVPVPVAPRKSGTTTPTTTASSTAMPTATAAPIAPAPTAAATAPEEPWTAMLEAPLVKFDDAWFQPRRLSRDVESLQRWWTTVSGQQRPIGGDERFGLHMSGFFELRAPWQAGTVLTLWTADQQNDILRLHLCSGDRGLTLERRQRSEEQWVAYTATKKAAQPRPQTISYAAGDNDRARRTGDGPIDLRYHEGRVLVSRGDVLLLAAPLAAAPQSVFLEGTAVLKGIGLARVEGMPKRWLGEDAQFSSPFDYAQPVDWPEAPAERWLTELPAGAKFEPLGKFGGALSVVDSTKPAWAAFALPTGGLYDLVCEFDQADANTGFYLGDDEGRSRYALGFYEQQPGESLLLGPGRPTETRNRYRYDPRQGPLPAVGFPARLRLIVGAGIVKVYASADGRTWGRIIEPIRGIDGMPTTIGLYCAPGKGKRRITLTRVRHSMYLKVDPDVVAQTRPLPETGGYGAWLVDALRREKDERRPLTLHDQAAALLVKGVRADLARLLLSGLATPAFVEEDGEVVARYPYDFATLCLAADTFDGQANLDWYRHFLQDSPRLPGESLLPSSQRIEPKRIRWMESPLATNARLPFLPPELIRNEIFELVHRNKWNELDRLCRVLHFFGGRVDSNLRRQPQREPIMDLVDWAAAQAERRRTTPEGALPVAPQFVFKPEWRHPLIEQFGKEGYNVLAELETALQEKAYPDACRIITGVTAAQAVGLLPNAADAELLVSLPGAVALAMRTHPELRAAMQRDYGDLAQLRFRQASADGDVDAVEALTTQFYGTTAAAQAQTWLGDRALAQGDAPRAEGHYQAARSELPEGGDAGSIAARLRLAAAMQGRDSGDAPTASVVLGQWTLTPAEFERTVQELRARAPEMELGPRSASGAPTTEITSPIPPPARYKLKPFAKLEGEVGKNPDQPPLRDVDLIGAQISTTFADKRLIVCNRFQTAAYELADGKLAWRTGLGGEQGRTYAWPQVAMPPVVVDGRIYVRRLTANGPELACLDERNGAVLWRSPRGEVVASDPLVAGDRIQAVVLTVPQQDTLEAVLTTLEARSGKVLSRRPLVLLRDYWKRELGAALIPAGDVLLVHLAGCVIGCSPEGDLRWLRRLPWVPPSIPSFPPSGWPEAGRVVEGKFRVYGSAQDIYYVDIRTGAVGPPGLSYYLGPDSIQRDERYAPFHRLHHGADLFAVYEQDLNRKLWRPRMYWGSQTHGDTNAAWPAVWQKQRTSVGPVMAHAGRYFAFVAADLKSPTREIVELLPGAGLASEALDLEGSNIGYEWLAQVPEPLEKLLRERAWDLVQSRYDEKQWLENKLFLEDDCELTMASVDSPALWMRRVVLPQATAKLLRIRAAQAGGEPWLLSVQINGERVLEKKIESPTSGGSPWREEVVDLARFAGKEVQIVLGHVQPAVVKGSKGSLAAWQRMEIVDK